MREKTLHVLEYDKIIEMLKDRASSEMTRKVISELEPVCDARQIKEKQEETTEAVKLISAKGPLPVGGFYDVAGLAGFTRKGGVLTMAQLLQILLCLKGQKSLLIDPLSSRFLTLSVTSYWLALEAVIFFFN